MKKWALSAVVYLLIVVGGYYAYYSFTGNEPEAEHTAVNEEHATETNHSEVKEEHSQDESHSESSEEEGHSEGHSDHESTSVGESEVLPMIHEENGDLVITLKDAQGKPVSEIEVNHEKLMHLIVVSSDLKVYNHLHPVTEKPGVFKTPHTLKDGEYKIFVDIKPKNLSYKVQPITFIKGNPSEGHEHSNLEADTSLVKLSGGHSATLQPSSLVANEEIQLNFDLNGEHPEQHLGALGHVVILDENAENYIHVHPLDGDKPVFETKFTQPGKYKIWAEFKFNGEVNVFPYVVEIK
ncbi:hypothetical protein ACFSO7_10460 [Bacillus sp. CGMCC 1.16607]|uniref:hypothetical protein n=1 Tax=Bacillus sp. CGMCC 1.16607 TaxID=3351842 RepID=UPI003635A2B8